MSDTISHMKNFDINRVKLGKEPKKNQKSGFGSSLSVTYDGKPVEFQFPKMFARGFENKDKSTGNIINVDGGMAGAFVR